MKRVKIFQSTNSEQLEKDINDWLKKTVTNALEMSTSTIFTNRWEVHTTVVFKYENYQEK